MMTLNLGPLALPLAPLITLAALFLATWAARRWSTADEREAADAALWWSAAVGLLMARVAHVAFNRAAYVDEPLSMLDIRDGGFLPWAGVVGGGAFLLWRLRGRVVASRRVVLTAAAAGVLLWAVAGPVIGVFKPAPGQDLSQIMVRLQPVSVAAASGPREADASAAAGARPDSPAVWSPTAALTLAELQQLSGGKPLIVNLWATWCPPCRAEMPLLARAQRDHPEVLIVLVNQGESEAAIRSYLARERLELQQLWRDPASALGPALGSGALPTTVVFDAQGRRVKAHVGMVNEAALRVMIRSVVPAPAMPPTPAVLPALPPPLSSR